MKILAKQMRILADMARAPLAFPPFSHFPRCRPINSLPLIKHLQCINDLTNEGDGIAQWGVETLDRAQQWPTTLFSSDHTE